MLPLAELHERDVVSRAGWAKPGSGMFQPFTCDPVTEKLGRADGGTAGQMSVTSPSTEREAIPLSVMLPLDQMSPLTVVVEEPVKVIESPAPPPPPAGLSVWMAAPLVPLARATAGAGAAIGIGGLAPATCMMVTGT